MNSLWEEARDEFPRLQRCVAAYERRYPRSNRSFEFRGRLKKLVRRRRWRWVMRGVAAAILAAAILAGSDLLAFYQASSFERAPDSSAPAVARRWSELLERHPSLPAFWPALAREARQKKGEWQVKAADVQVANGTAPVDLTARLGQLKDQRPQLVPEIKKVEAAQEQVRHDERWKSVQAEVSSLAAIDDPETPLATIDAFLRAFPETPRRAEALVLARSLKNEIAAKRSAAERRIVDDLIQSESLPNVSLIDQIDRARLLSPSIRIVQFARRCSTDSMAICKNWMNATSSGLAASPGKTPLNLPTRIERYQDYLKAHQTGGKYISEAIEAKDRILHEWDTYAYRQAYDHAVSHPDDVAEVARRLREYLRDQPDGHHIDDAKHYLDWWDKVSVPGHYRVTLRRGEVEPTAGKYFAGGAPDLGVVVEVAGTVYGPSSVIRDSHRPIWDYTFPQPITWKLGDPVTIRIIDYDWSASEIYVLNSQEGDPLAMRILTGTIKPAKGGRTSLVFSSDFSVPTLTPPE